MGLWVNGTGAVCPGFGVSRRNRSKSAKFGIKRIRHFAFIGTPIKTVPTTVSFSLPAIPPRHARRRSRDTFPHSFSNCPSSTCRLSCVIRSNKKRQTKGKLDMTEKERDQLAYFRYSVIVPLLGSDDSTTLERRMKQQAERIWTLPDGRLRQFAWGTLEKWLYNYKRLGMAGLTDASRRDVGAFRKMPIDVSEEIDRILSEHPGLKSNTIIRDLRAREFIKNGRPSRSTLFRYIKNRRPRALEISSRKERRAFEAPRAGALWQTDIMYGPHLGVVDESSGKRVKRATYLVAIMDDHSRLIPHAEFFFAQDLLAYLKTLKTAILKRGIPEKLYCDNGKVFLAPQIKRIAAEIGVIVLHTAVRDAAAKGKIERFFRTVRDRFLEPFRLEGLPGDLEVFNRYFQRWLERDYNNKKHGSIDCAPMEKWMLGSNKVRMLDYRRESEVFRFMEERVVRKDGTFLLNGTLYETNWTLAGRKVRLLFDPFAPAEVAVQCEGRGYGTANPLQRNVNYSIKRTAIGER